MRETCIRLCLPLVGAIVLTGARASAQALEWQLSPVNAHWYALSPQLSSGEAEALAVSKGGHLVTVRSAQENSWLGSVYFEPFIGFTDQQAEGTWVWVSGEPVTYTNWAGGQPDNLNNSDIARLVHGSGVWVDTSASAPQWVLEVISPDCDGDGFPDVVAIAENPSLDLDENGALDECQDCNRNGVFDFDDIAMGTSQDCNGNGLPDECDIAAGTAPDCNLNGAIDDCEIASGQALDLDLNGVPDECDEDCNSNGFPDFLDLFYGLSPDCNGNEVPDECDISTGVSLDCNTNSVPDSCDIASSASLDCDLNQVPDECDILQFDCNGNGVPDPCDIADGSSLDLNGDGFPDECKPDCNANGVPDYLDVYFGVSEDCNEDLVPDECQAAAETTRVGVPANPPAFLPGATSGPAIGTTWDPVVDHSEFMPNALFDFLLLSPTTMNLDLGGNGTLLVGPPFLGPLLVSPGPGVPFSIAIPDDCALIGLLLGSQAASDEGIGFQLTNALDIKIGSL